MFALLAGHRSNQLHFNFISVTLIAPAAACLKSFYLILSIPLWLHSFINKIDFRWFIVECNSLLFFSINFSLSTHQFHWFVSEIDEEKSEWFNKPKQFKWLNEGEIATAITHSHQLIDFIQSFSHQLKRTEVIELFAKRSERLIRHSFLPFRSLHSLPSLNGINSFFYK